MLLLFFIFVEFCFRPILTIDNLAKRFVCACSSIYIYIYIYIQTRLMEGLSLRPKGAAALLHRRGESPLWLNTRRSLTASEEGLPLQPKGASGSAAPGVGAPSATERAAQLEVTDGGVKSSQVELYCHSATCVDIERDEMSCLTGPRCYINTDIQHGVKTV